MSLVAPRSLPLTGRVLSAVLITGVFLTGSARVRLGPDFANVVQAAPGSAEPLLPGKPLTRKLGGGETHLYQVQINSEQYLKVVIEQHGIDLNVSAFAPNGDPIA